ncbi:hypothetical protein ACP70R_033754 [Stipagrostis hirtigluma subsp. patula]
MIARILADEGKKRVIIVDTSNEIGGDGDVPHSGIGRARRMQVPKVSMQHNVMIEAVENHMPEVIIIDEIGTELEAIAASTIAQRGVQLVGTAHGVTIESIVKNPCLQMLVGGIEEKPPKFEAHKMANKSTESDRSLVVAERGYEIEPLPLYQEHMVTNKMPSEDNVNNDFGSTRQTKSRSIPSDNNYDDDFGYTRKTKGKKSVPGRPLVRVYTYQISEADILQVATVMGFDDELDVTDDIGAADVILASSSEMKQNPWIQNVAKYHKLPIFVVKTNTMAQIVKAVRMIVGRDNAPSPKQPTVMEGERD